MFCLGQKMFLYFKSFEHFLLMNLYITFDVTTKYRPFCQQDFGNSMLKGCGFGVFFLL